MDERKFPSILNSHSDLTHNPGESNRAESSHNILEDPEFVLYLNSHYDLTRDLGEGDGADSEAIVKLIRDGVSLSHRLQTVEDRRKLRMILRLWAARLVRRGFEYPDIDIDQPHRKPSEIRLRKPWFEEGQESNKSADSIDTKTAVWIEDRRIPVSDIAKIEREIPRLKIVFVVAHYIERPRGELQDTVEYNFDRGVRYRFVISASSYNEGLSGYFELFKSLATIVARERSGELTVEDLISIGRLDYEWGECPYLFYQYVDDNDKTQTVALRGDQKQEGIAEHYVLVEPHSAKTLLEAVLHAATFEEGQEVQLSTEELTFSTNVLPFPLREAINAK